MEATGAAAIIGVSDLDDSALLSVASEAERLDRMVQRRKLRIAYEWCVRHPATSESGTATWGDAGLPCLGDCDASLAGGGTPGVRRSWRRSSVPRWESPRTRRWR